LPFPMSSFFFHATTTTAIYTLSLHDALPISGNPLHAFYSGVGPVDAAQGSIYDGNLAQLSDFDAANPQVLEHLAGAYEQWIEQRSEEHTSELQSRENLVCRLLLEKKKKQL